MDNTNHNRDSESTSKANKKTSKKIIHRVLGITLFIILSFFAIIPGRYLFKRFSEKRNELAISKLESSLEEHLEKINLYVPGTTTDNSYTSEYWNILYEINREGWRMYTEEELLTVSENMLQNAIKSGEKSLENGGVPDELIKKWRDSVYTKTEMGTFFVADDMIVGEITFDVFSSYEIGNLKPEEYADMLKSSVASNADSLSVSEDVIAGESYHSVSFTYRANDMEMAGKIYMRVKDDFILIINGKCLRGYESMFDSFITQVSRPD